MEQKKCFGIVVLIIIFLTSIIGYFSSKYSLLLFSSYPSLSFTKQPQNTSIDSNVLLFYVYADTHQYAYGNLKYFIDTAVRENDGVDYIFILQQVENKTIDESQLPKLPKGNAFYFQHENVCYDYGSIGWFIETHTIGNPWRKTTSTDTGNQTRKFDLRKYKYFITMNASIRGPYFPPYFLQFQSDYEKDFNKKFYWYYVFTQRLNEKLKLVGCTYNCAQPTHIQSYFLVTDFTGMSIWLKSGGIDGVDGTGVFGCYKTKTHTIWFSEMAATGHLQRANYTVMSLLSKYQSMEFSIKTDYCPVGGIPFLDKMLDGTSIEPFDVVFVKFNGVVKTIDAQERAKLYEKWREQARSNNRTDW